MGRTPDAPITKEIKPTAAIAWKKIGFGEIKFQGKPVELIDCPPDKAFKLKGTLHIKVSIILEDQVIQKLYFQHYIVFQVLASFLKQIRSKIQLCKLVQGLRDQAHL